MSEAGYVTVLLDQNLQKPLDYAIPAELRGRLRKGVRVEVPLRGQTVKGTCESLKHTSKVSGIRPILRILDDHGNLSPALWKLAEWMSEYYVTPLQKVLRCFVPPNIRKEISQQKQLFCELIQSDAKVAALCETLRNKAPAQARLLDLLLPLKKGIYLKDLLKEPGSSRTAVDALVKKKIIKIHDAADEEDLLLEAPFFSSPSKTLYAEQKTCLEALKQAIDSQSFSAHLLFGVTGSGKTEVYLQAIQATLDAGKNVILLLPEISLTSQTIERFRARFSEKLAILHHKRSSGERSRAWENLQKNEVRIVIGARSAIFCPVQNLGLIIVDEEHDSSYKQSEEPPCYQARDVAVMRAFLEKAVVVLGSATPSLESRYNAEKGKYQLHTLPQRAGSSQLPKVHIVDLQVVREQTGGFTHFSPLLLKGIEKRLETGEQTLLLLNRRGYHRMQVCQTCREVIKCPHCDLALTFHKKEEKLRCHLCDFKREPPRNCPVCKQGGILEFKGFGTEHVERSLHAIFPQVRTLRMDRDTTQTKLGHEDLFRQFRAHKADVLIGTQMIAKGLHFPGVTLVGVLNIDSSLTIPDFRSPEQCFQLLTQVAGRAGREHILGEVIFQTYFPDHPIIQLAAKQDYPAFYEMMREERSLFCFPPFCHLVKVSYTHESLEKALFIAQKGHDFVKERVPEKVTLFPPVPAGHPKVKNLYHVHFLLKAAKMGALSPLLRQLPQEGGVKVDVDPNSTFF